MRGGDVVERIASSGVLRVVMLGLLAAGSGPGCAETIQSSLQDGLLNVAKVAKVATRKAHVASVTVVDERDPEELELQKPAARYALFVGFYFQGNEGDLRPAARWISADTRTELSSLIRSALRRSELLTADRSGPAFSVRIVLKHLYSFRHMSYDFGFFFTGGYASVTTFHPYGFAAAEVVVTDAQGRTVGVRRVTGTSEVGVSLDGTSLSFRGSMAAADLAGNIVKATEAILADQPMAAPLPMADAPTFFIARAIPEGPYLEVAGIDFETGNVTSDLLVPRTMEPYSAVDEWVVDPYGGTPFMMAQDDYENLVRRLQQRYSVRYTTSVRVARFLGVRR